MITQLPTIRTRSAAAWRSRVCLPSAGSAEAHARSDRKARNARAGSPLKIMTVRRYDLCSVKRLQSKEDIDKYVEAIREKLMKTLESCDGVQIN